MGNKLILEEEIVHERLPDWSSRDVLYLHQNTGILGEIYDISGSGKREIFQYARVYNETNAGVAKMGYNKICLNNTSPTIFINVRKSTLTRRYENGTPHTFGIVVGDYNGNSYNITYIYNH